MRKKLITGLCVVLMLGLVGFISSFNLVFAGTEQKDSTRKYLVGFNAGTNENLIVKSGGKVTRKYSFLPLVAAEVPDKAIEALKKNPNIAYIEEDAKAYASEQIVPWGIPHVNATEVQQIGYSGEGIKVGILDTGIDYTHEDLNVAGGISFVIGTNDYLDDNGHGSHVAGILSGLNNSVGVLGASPKSSIYAIKVLDKYGGGNYSDVISGIEWAITNGMNILNLSLGGTSDSRSLKAAVDKAYSEGILLVAAAGNNGYGVKGTITYPAAYSAVIAVGAVGQNNERAGFSSVGKQLELMAPGVYIESSTVGGYEIKSGTSMAAPHVAGVASIILQANPVLGNIQLRNVLNETAMLLGESFYYGNGLVDAVKAFNSVNQLDNQPKVKGNQKK